MSNSIMLKQDADLKFYRSLDGKIIAETTTCGEFGNFSAIKLVTSKGDYLVSAKTSGSCREYSGYAGKFHVLLTHTKVGWLKLEW